MVDLWVTLLLIGLMTFAIRLSFILLLEKWKPPVILERALRFVPAAVLSAIIFPELLIRNGELNLSMSNPRLIAGAMAILVAWRTRSPLLTIGVGFGALLLIQRWLGIQGVNNALVNHLFADDSDEINSGGQITAIASSLFLKSYSQLN